MAKLLKRLGSLALALIMVASLLPMNVFAETAAVAEPEGNTAATDSNEVAVVADDVPEGWTAVGSYDALKTAVKNKASKIFLTAPFTTTAQVSIDFKTTIDFNGHTITLYDGITKTGTTEYYPFYVGGNVVLQDTSADADGGLLWDTTEDESPHSGSPQMIRVGGGSLTINSGVYEAKSGGTGNVRTIYSWKATTINGGTIKASSLGECSAIQMTTSGSTKYELTINKATIEASSSKDKLVRGVYLSDPNDSNITTLRIPDNGNDVSITVTSAGNARGIDSLTNIVLANPKLEVECKSSYKGTDNRYIYPVLSAGGTDISAGSYRGEKTGTGSKVYAYGLSMPSAGTGYGTVTGGSFYAEAGTKGFAININNSTQGLTLSGTVVAEGSAAAVQPVKGITNVTGGTYKGPAAFNFPSISSTTTTITGGKYLNKAGTEVVDVTSYLGEGYYQYTDGTVFQDAHQYADKAGGQAPTCTEDGVKDYYQCKYCEGYFYLEGESKVDIENLTEWLAGAGIITQTGHNFPNGAGTACANGCGTIACENGHTAGTKVEAEPHTCYKDGHFEHYICSVCGSTVDAEGNFLDYDTQVKDPAAHTNRVYVPQKDATFDETGLEDYWYCDACGEYYAGTAESVGEQIEAPVVIQKVPVLAKIGEERYASLAAAVAAAQENAVIVINADFSLPVDSNGDSCVITADKKITIDLNGKKLTFAGELQNEGTLTLKDSGTDGQITFTGGVGIRNDGNGVLTIDSGYYKATGATGSNNPYVVYQSGKVCTINNGKFEAVNDKSKIITAVFVNKNTAYINDGEFIVKGATTNAVYGLRVYNGKLEMNGGTVTVNASASGTQTTPPVAAGIQVEENRTLIMRGGSVDVTYTGTRHNVYGIRRNGSANVGSITISGDASVSAEITNTSSARTCYGVCANAAPVDILGNAKITASTKATGNCYGVYVSRHSVDISGNVSIEVDSTTAAVYGVYNTADGIVTISENVKIDGESAKTCYGIDNRGSLTVSDNVEITVESTSKGNSATALYLSGNTTINGNVNISANNSNASNTSNPYGINIWKGTTTINGNPTVYATSAAGGRAANTVMVATSTPANKPTLNIYGGTYTAEKKSGGALTAALRVGNNATVTVYDGTFVALGSPSSANAHAIHVETSVDSNNVNHKGSAVLEVKDGIFKNNGDSHRIVRAEQVSDGDKVTITGGKFVNHSDAKCAVNTDFLAAGYYQHTDGTVFQDAHQYADKVDGQAETCTEDGLKEHYVCQYCGVAYYLDGETKVLIDDLDAWKIIPKKNHAYPEQWTDAGDGSNHKKVCENDATHVLTEAHTYGAWVEGKKTCTACGAETTCEHVFEYTPDGNATCTADGTKSATCPTCGTKSTIADVGSALNHDFVNGTVKENFAGNCQEKSFVTTKCARCDETKTVYGEVNMSKHADLKQVPAQAPTCTAIGWDAYEYCTECDYTTYAEKGMLNHTYGDPTFTWAETKASATATFTCDCGDTKVENGVITSKINTPATCEGKGERTFTATVTFNGVTYTDDVKVEIPAKGHDFENGTVTETFAGNCQTESFVTTKCARCDETKTVYGEVNMNVHTKLVKDDAVAATCTATGLTEGEHCEACGTVTKKQETVDALNHKFENYTNNGDGTHTGVCANDASHTDTAAHNFVNGTCDKCGAAEKTNVAEVGGTGYATLAEAIAAADGKTVKLLTDLEIVGETITIADGKKVTLDMNGKKITVTDNKTSNYELFYIYGELTVTGNGTIELTSTTNRNWNAMSAIFHNRGGELTIENGTYRNLGGTDMAWVVDNSGNYYGDATTNINGGELTSTYTAIRNRMEQNSHGASGKATVNVTGGTINGTTSAIWAQAASESTTAPATGEINVSGGTVGLINTARSAGAVSMTTITGGTVAGFKGEVGELTVKGGELTGTVTILTADGQATDYEITEDGLYAPASSVAEVDGTGYATLDDAIAAADGKTVTLLKDIELTETITIAAGKTITLDLNGKTLVYESTIQGEAMITNKGNLTINDSVDGGVINYNYIGAADPSYGKGNYTISNGGNLTVNGGKITIADLRGHAKYPIDNNSTTGNAVLTINGGHLYNYNTCAIRQFCNSTAYSNIVTINGGLIEGFSAIWMQNPGKNTVNGKLTITGGEIKTTAKAYVNGTSALKDVASKIYCTTEGGAWTADSAVAITGGIINENVYLAESAPESITIGDATFNGYVQLPGLKGKGTETDPYLIGSVEELILFRDSVNAGEGKYNGAYVKLVADIDLAGINWEPIGNVGYNSKYAPADATKVFSGTFDGNGKVISNLSMTKILNGGADAEANLGLFGITGEGAVIKDLTITNVNINTDGRNVGALVAFGHGATIDNITVNGDIQIKGGNNVSGVCAMTRYSAVSVTNITVKGNAGSYIKGNNIVGGIFAEIAPNGAAQTFQDLSIENVAISGVGGVGGIVGLLTTGTVENVSVKNVALTGKTEYQGNAMGRIRLGSVAGLMGGKFATIANATVENVTAKNLDGDAVVLPVIGANYDASSNATEAKIGNTYYATFAAAYAAAKAGDTVELLQPIVVAKGQTLTLNKDVNIVYTSNVVGEDMITVRGTLNVAAGKITYTNTDKTGNNVTVSTISCEPGSVLNVTGGTIENKTVYSTGSYAYAIDLLTNGNLGDVTATISGGKVYSDYMAIRQFNNGTACKNSLTVTGGEIYGAKRAIQVHMDNNAAYLTISGGKVEAGEGGYALCLFPTTATNIAVKGGTFSGTVYSGTNGIISGGIFNEEVYEEYCAEGYLPTDNGDGTYGVIQGLKGKGTEADPYQIGSIADLILFRDSVNAGETRYNAPGVYVALTADIDMAGIDWSVNIGDDCNVTFDGIFDGNGKTISNLTAIETAQKADGYVCTGLFGAIAGKAVIKNLTIANATIDTGDFTGNNASVVVGFAWAATGSIENVKVVDATINANKIDGTGAIVGYAYSSTLKVTDCTVENTTVNGQAYVGGVIGYAGGKVTLNGNTVTGTTVNATSCAAGGVAGIIQSGSAADNTVNDIVLTSAHENWKNAVGVVVGTYTGNSVTVSGTITNSTAAIVGVKHADKPTAPLAKTEAKIGDTYYATFAAAYAAAKANDTITLLTDLTASDIIVIDKAITLNGNGHKLTSTAGRAINIDTTGKVVINDLTINAGERAINIINKASTVELNNVTATAKNNAVMIATSAGAAKLTINDSDLTGLAVVNVAGAGAEVAINNTKITNLDATSAENYGAISIFKTAENTKVTVKGGEIVLGDDSVAASNGAEGANVTFEGTVGAEKVQTVVAYIGDAGYTSLQSAINDAKAGQTVTLIRDVTAKDIITINKAITLNGNGKTLTSAAGRAINIDTTGKVVINDLTINAGERAINIINKASTVELNNVTATAKNNAVMIATSAGAAKLTINDSDLTGLAVVNVAGAGAEVAINNTNITNVDASSAEQYGAITVWSSADAAKVTVTGGSITVADDSREAYVFPGDATIEGVEDVGYIVATVGDAGFETLQAAINHAKAGNTVKLIRDVKASAIITIDKAITLDGNGKTLTSTAGRAINVDGADGATIKNLTIDAKGERAINVIGGATNVTIDNVTATAANYTVNLAGSAANAVVAIKNSNLTGLNTVNVAAAGAKVTVVDSTVNCNDNNTTAGEVYAALCLNKDAVGASIIATGTTVNVTEGSDSEKGRNGAEDGTVTINGSTEGVTVTVAVITYEDSDYYYGFTSIEAAIEFAKEGDTVTLIRDVTASEIVVIDKAITLDGNGKKLTSTAGRAINVDGADGATIKNLTIDAKGERAINVINGATNVTVDNVTATAANYTVNLAGSAANAVVAIKNSNLTGLNTVNVAAAGAKVTVVDSTVNCNDNNTTAGEVYAALCLNKDAVGASIIATGTTVNVTEGSDSEKGRNGAEDGTVTINGSTEGVTVTVAVITYEGSDYYYGFTSIEAAIEFAKEGDTVTLIRDVTAKDIIVIDKAITLDGNGKTLTSTATRAINIDCADKVLIKDLTIATTANTERAINVIQKAADLTLENVTAEGFKYTLNVASSSVGSDITVNGGKLSGYAAINIAGNSTTVTVNDAELIGVNNVPTHESNNFAVIAVAADSVKATVNGGSLTATSTTGNRQFIVGAAYATNAKVTVDAELNLVNGDVFNGKVEQIAASFRAEYADELLAQGYMTETSATAGLVDVAGVAAASVNGVGYTKLQDAIDAAEALGEATVVVLNDQDLTSHIIISDGITLDLNGKTVKTTRYFTVYGDVVDGTAGGEGIVIAAKTHVMGQKSFMSIYDSAAGGYRFYAFEVVSAGFKDVDATTVKFGIKLEFVNAEAYTLIANGDTKLELHALITWTGLAAPMDYTFSDATVKSYASLVAADLANSGSTKKAITLTFTGVEVLGDDGQINVTPVLESETSISGAAATINWKANS